MRAGARRRHCPGVDLEHRETGGADRVGQCVGRQRYAVVTAWSNGAARSPVKKPTSSPPPGRRTRAASANGRPMPAGPWWMSEYQASTPAKCPSSAGTSSTLPRWNRADGWVRRACSTNAGTWSSPTTSSPRSARWPLQWPGPHPASSTGPPSPAAHVVTRWTSAACIDTMDPSCSVYSAARRPYASRTAPLSAPEPVDMLSRAAASPTGARCTRRARRRRPAPPGGPSAWRCARPTAPSCARR